MTKKNGNRPAHSNGDANGSHDQGGAIAPMFSDQIGYRVVQRGQTECVEPINPKRQASFEAAAAQLRQI